MFYIHKRYLDISKKHLDYIDKNFKRKKPGEPKIDIGTFNHSIELDHAYVSSIFSAFAVEAAMNLFISLKMLHLTNKKFVFLNKWIITERYNVKKKVELMNHLEPKLDLKFKEDKIQQLFDYRNKLVHPKAKYISGPMKSPTDKGEIIEIQVEGVTYNGPTSSDITDAKDNYQIAQEIIKKINTHIN